MPASAEPPDTAARRRALVALVEDQQIRLIFDQVRRMPLMHFALDLVIAWTGVRAGLGTAAWVWLVLITLAKAARLAYLRRLQAAEASSAQRKLAAHANALGLVACVQVAIMTMVFAHPPGDAQYVLTMVLMGNAAGAVSTSAGHLRTFATWVVIFMGGLVACWLSRLSLEGAAIAVLLMLMTAMLLFYVRDQARTLLRLVTLTEDLRTERDKLARMSDDLRQERDRAERASEAKTRFFASASHDLRQPLTALSYNAATVQALAESTGDETLGRVSHGISRALRESRSLLDSLLEISELDAGVVDVRLADVDLQALLAEVRESFAPLAAERGLDLVLHAPREPASSARTDVALLRRIVLNLVSNAIKFTANGSVTLWADTGPAADEVAVHVADTGPGIPAEVQDRIFEEFFQLGNAERNRSRGLGLGLAIVRRLAALLDARVEVASGVAQGSTFTIRLPRGAQSAAPAPAVAATAATARPLARSRRILVVDDERDIRDALSTLLVALGWQVVAEPGGDEALACVARGFDPDALIVDFRLRDGASGLDALAALRRAGCGAPAWLITGETEPGRIADARAAGIPVIYKPVDGLALAALLREAFEGAPVA